VSDQNGQATAAVAEIETTPEAPKPEVLIIWVNRDPGDEQPGVEDEPHVVCVYN
jgi:hypothetical protein